MIFEYITEKAYLCTLFYHKKLNKNEKKQLKSIYHGRYSHSVILRFLRK